MIFYKKKIFGCFYFMKDEKANRFKTKKLQISLKLFLVARSGIEPLLHG